MNSGNFRHSVTTCRRATARESPSWSDYRRSNCRRPTTSKGKVAPPVAYGRNVQTGLTLFELTEHVRVRRPGANRHVRISDLPPTRRCAPQSLGEADETRDMPTGRCVSSAHSPRHDAPWQHEWTESQQGEFVSMANAIANALEEAVPGILKQVEDAKQRERERRAATSAELNRAPGDADEPPRRRTLRLRETLRRARRALPGLGP